jgi:hypothetical protein
VSGAPGPQGPGAALRRGLASPNLLVVAVALVVSIFCLLGLQWAFTSGRFATVAEARFLRTSRDDWGHISWQVGRLKRRPPARTAIYLLGGSNVRECISSGADLSRAIEEGGGPATVVYDLGSTEQHLGESLAIVDNVPQTRGVVVIGVNQTRFQYSPAAIAEQLKGRELLLASPTLRQFLIDRGEGGRRQVTILPGILNYLGGWVQKNQSTLARGRLPVNRYQQHRYTQTDIWSQSLKRSKVELWVNTKGRPGGDFDSNLEINKALLEAMVERARERGFTPVLLEVPENTDIVAGRFDTYKAQYQSFCRGLAEKYDGYYLDFGGDIGLVNEDFRDLTHLVEPGRAKWTPALAEALLPSLQSTQEGEPAP